MFNRFSGNINIIWVMVSQPIFLLTILQLSNVDFYLYSLYKGNTFYMYNTWLQTIDKVYNFSILCLSYLGNVIPSNQSKVSCGLLHQCISMCGIERKLVIM